MLEANRMRAGLARIVGQEISGLALMGPHTYRVTAVHVDAGPPLSVRCDLEPVEPRMMPLSRVDQWPSVGGSVVAPVVGTECIVEFRDLKSSRPMITRFHPLREAGGAPVTTTIDASAKVAIGEHSTTVELGGSSAVALALAGPLATWAALVNTALSSAGHPIAALTGAATTKVKGV